MDNEQERKLFVGGLNKELTTEDDLENYFASYGAVVSVSIMRDQEKNSRGFGFVVFEDATAVDSIIAAKKDKDIVVNGRNLHVKRALPPVPGGKVVASRSEYRKIFVGGLPHIVTQEDLRTHFEQFGRVDEVELLKDPQTQRLRGFAFITFQDEDCADRCLQRRTHEICRKVCEVKKAQGKTQKERNPVQSNNTAAASSAKTLPTAEVNLLIQQAYIMGQQTSPPAPSNSQHFNNPLLQALREQLAPPKPTAPAPEDPLMRVANFFHNNGVNATALAGVLKETQSEGGGGGLLSSFSTSDNNSKGNYRYTPY